MPGSARRARNGRPWWPAGRALLPCRRQCRRSPRAAAASIQALRPVAVVDLARGDLLEGDLQVVLRVRVDHRRRVLVERPLTEVVVVRVDLTGALGGYQNTRIVGVDTLQKGVEAGLDHSVAPSKLQPHTLATRSSRSCTAWPRSSLTIVLWKCSASARASSSSSRARERRRSITSGVSVPRSTSRSRRVSRSGGRMNT